MSPGGRVAVLTRLRAATALQVAIGTVGEAIEGLGPDAVALVLDVRIATEPATISQGNIVGTSDSLVSPRHLDVSAEVCSCVRGALVDGSG